MGKDLYVFNRCRKCRHMNQFELLRSDDGQPFDINNEKHWKLLNTVMKEDIDEARKRYHQLDNEERKDLIDTVAVNIYNDGRVCERDISEKEFISAELKFTDEGAFNFLHCDKCGEPLMFFVISE